MFVHFGLAKTEWLLVLGSSYNKKGKKKKKRKKGNWSNVELIHFVVILNEFADCEMNEVRRTPLIYSVFVFKICPAFSLMFVCRLQYMLTNASLLLPLTRHSFPYWSTKLYLLPLGQKIKI